MALNTSKCNHLTPLPFKGLKVNLWTFCTLPASTEPLVYELMTVTVKVEDVVGYNTLGHCFFMEDGNERDNVLVHNLGLVTKPGSLLPSDRDAAMCTALSVAARRFQYVPDAYNECMYTSTS